MLTGNILNSTINDISSDVLTSSLNTDPVNLNLKLLIYEAQKAVPFQILHLVRTF
jgi:hypothetical protein